MLNDPISELYTIASALQWTAANAEGGIEAVLTTLSHNLKSAIEKLESGESPPPPAGGSAKPVSETLHPRRPLSDKPLPE